MSVQALSDVAPLCISSVSIILGGFWCSEVYLRAGLTRIVILPLRNVIFIMFTV